ncbi:MAG: Zn-ribbon domain-containing OB-fold protein, partial [Chloroflexia bacterium]
QEHARLVGTHCPECGWTYMPPRIYCERCFRELTEWVEVPPSGTIYAYTVVHLDLQEQPLEKPEVLAFVRLEGCDGGLIHRVLAEPGQLYIGMPVEVVFREEREGSILDIVGFRPA